MKTPRLLWSSTGRADYRKPTPESLEQTIEQIRAQGGAGARRIIRVGTCGALQPNIAPGHLVIPTAAVQNTGYGWEMVPKGYPAVADVDLIQALRRSATDQGVAFSCGLVLTRDAFYQGVAPAGKPDYARMARANVLAVEMECAGLFIVASLRKARAGAILAVDGNVLEGGGEAMDTYKPQQEAVVEAIKAEIKIALEALKLMQRDISSAPEDRPLHLLPACCWLPPCRRSIWLGDKSARFVSAEVDDGQAT